ncbi:MAG TPA: translation initiation factor IF-6 [Methanomicrobiales archaeon]|jgi:translation initiation factor 6|nr:translation initiation factor IF-6 [Methanomicrobiales archaeon]
MSSTIAFAGDPHIGVFARILEDLAILAPQAPEGFRAAIEEELDAEVVETTIQDSAIVGALAAGNRQGVVVSGLASREEVARIGEHREVMILGDGMNAAGNVILANDTFAAVNPELPLEVAEEIGSFLRVPVLRLSFAGYRAVGKVAVATNRGILVHPRANPAEIAALEEAVDLPIGVGTVNMGSGLVGSGLLANSRGYLAGIGTSGFELGRIEEVLGFLE